jgi:hypothetical protein
MKLECDVVKDLYILYQENELSPSVRQAVDEHLQSCDACAAIYREGTGFEDPLKKDEPEEPSKQLDEKMKLRLKLRRMRIALIFALSVLLIYTHFEYTDDRKSLLYAISQLEQPVNHLRLSVGSAKQGAIVDSFITVISELNEKSSNVIRFMNFIENNRLEKINTDFAVRFGLADFLEHLNERYENGSWSEKDEAALRKMQGYFEDYTKLLTNERLKLNGIHKTYDIPSRWKPINIEGIASIHRGINELAYIYTHFHQFPEEVAVLSREEVAERLKSIFSISDANVVFLEYANRSVKSTGQYTFDLRGEGTYIYGTADAFTGEVLGFSNHFELTTGEFIPEQKAAESLNQFLQRNFGTEMEFNVKYLGMNYNFSSNVNWQLYTYELQPLVMGDKTEGKLYRVYVDARTGKIYSFSLLRN